MAVYTELNSAWKIIENALSLECGKLICTEEELTLAVNILHKHGIGNMLGDWFMEQFQTKLNREIAPRFWKKFEEEVNNESVIDVVKESFSELFKELQSILPCMDRLLMMNDILYIQDHQDKEKNRKQLECKVRLLYKAVVFPRTTKHFQNAMHTFYSQAFKAFDAKTGQNVDMDETDEDADSALCQGCNQVQEDCGCDQTLEAFKQLNKQLSDLGLLERLSGDAVTSLIHNRIKAHVGHSCRGNFETTYIAPLEQWLQNKVVVWLELLYGKQSQEGTTDHINANKERLYHFMYEIYANIRIQELFNIIIEFPESEPALLDLKTCLQKTDLRGKLVYSLKTALETRLLHPGVNTADILTAYISAIRALRVLDPAGVLLDLVCQPVRKYLRNRDDTVRCIVSSLTEDSSNSELSDELVKAQPLVLDESYHSEDDNENWETWIPDPVDADPSKTSQSGRSSDIISMLVNIYGSKELFVNEYRTLLADRILTHFNYDTEKEIRYLELLKLRFGESQLHYCEVMLKDVADSKRINSYITEQKEAQKQKPDNEENIDEGLPVNCMILSDQFWPTFREEKVEVPDFMKQSLERYTKAYEALKGNRTLNWKPHLGLVNLEIEIKDRKLNLSVSPVHATIIWHFQEKSTWTVEDLSGVMHMPTAALRRKMAFWQSQGLLKEQTVDTFVLVEDHKGRTHDVMIIDEEETESAMASASVQREEELQVQWSYINGMLTNFESLPIERIHSMLTMFAMQGPSSGDISLSELKVFLDRKVREGKLLHSGGVYRLPKST